MKQMKLESNSTCYDAAPGQGITYLSIRNGASRKPHGISPCVCHDQHGRAMTTLPGSHNHRVMMTYRPPTPQQQDQAAITSCAWRFVDAAVKETPQASLLNHGHAPAVPGQMLQCVPGP